MAKKYYVIWQGKQTGVVDDWVKCLDAIRGYPGAKYKAYKSLADANAAFQEGYKKHWGKGDVGLKEYSSEVLNLIGEPVYPSVAVNCSWNFYDNKMEYQGVDTLSGERLFHQGPFEDANQHMGEFLALVHALAYLKQQGSTIPVYSQSKSSMLWILKGKAYGGTLEPTEKNTRVLELIRRANKWLSENTFENELLKWNKGAWGENPADLRAK